MTRPVCLITGASVGIGAACANLAAQRGYDLVLTYNTDHQSADAVARSAQQAGAQTLVRQVDVADPDAITGLYAQIDETFGRIDALINNAGIVAQTARVTDVTHDRLRALFDVNVIGAILVAKEAVLRMEPRGTGVIVNISSAAAHLGSANTYVDYAATKAAIDTFTKGLSDEVAPKGLRVMAVAPGLIATDIHAKGGDAGRVARLEANVPMRRAGTAMEIAKGVLWLMSDDASYMTGSTMKITGGR